GGPLNRTDRTQPALHGSAWKFPDALPVGGGRQGIRGGVGSPTGNHGPPTGGDGSWWCCKIVFIGRIARRLYLRYRVPKIKSRVEKRGGMRWLPADVGVLGCRLARRSRSPRSNC